MGTVQDRIDNRATAEIRGTGQINYNVVLQWYNKGLLIFQKQVLEYLANTYQITSVTIDTQTGKSDYALPTDINMGINSDFYSIAQLRVAYKEDKEWYPIYRRCEQINIADYNIRPTGRQKGQPFIFSRISKRQPKFSFISERNTTTNETESKIRIYPTPTEDITAGIHLTFNYIQQPVTLNTNEDKLLLPRYFLDVIDDYLTYRLIRAENPEMAQTHFQIFNETLHNNIYWLNRDQRPVDEEFWNFRNLYRN